jgi:hypothetical protein
VSRDAIDQREASRLQLAAIVGREPATSLLEIRAKRPAGPGMRQIFVPVLEIDRAARALRNQGELSDVYVGVCPRGKEAGTADAVTQSWVLWADVDTPEAVAHLRRFRPLPSIVLRSGTAGHLHAYWPLAEPLAGAFLERANRRLARALGADSASTDRARIMRAAGTWNCKTEPRRRVECVRCELDVFTVADVVADLPDDPRYLPKPPAPARIAARTDSPRILAGLTRVVREAPAGQRNNRLNWAAYRTGEHARNGTIDPTEAQTALLAAALDVGLGEPEALRTITSGLAAAERIAA